jgi:dTDP-4-amino-4,6-dideoxygalactose transaminase
MLAQGLKVAEFEENFAKFVGVKYAVATASGTTALQVALQAVGIGPGDEVITSPFTFIASANSTLYAGAKPVFTDINEKTFNIDPEKIEAVITQKTKAIMPVHLYGQPCDMTKIMAIARNHRLIVIEDACQAHGATWRDKKVGSLGLAGIFSFYPTKNMTTGEGGMITTNSLDIYEKANLLRNHGSKIKYYHDILGYNFRMTDMAAAIGIEQLKKLPKFNRVRQKNAAYLSKHLLGISGIIVPEVQKNAEHVFHQYTIRITPDFALTRDELLKKLTEAGIGTAIFYPLPINEQKLYRELGYKPNTPVAEKISKEVLSLPVHPDLKARDLEYIVSVFQRIKK